ncbi:hypothetical protein FOZ63_014430, partial [Perkinsus olseni]
MVRLPRHFRKEKIARDMKKKELLLKQGETQAAAAIIIPTAEDDAAFEESLTSKGTYFEDISKDDDCVIKFVKEILKGFNQCAVKLGERLKWWSTSYQPIISQDKDAFIRRYAKTERPLHVIGEDIQRYKRLQMDIQQQEFKVVVDFIDADFTHLMNELIKHCQQWHAKLTELLHQNAKEQLDSLLG